MMTRWLQNVLRPLQRGDQLLADGMQRLLRESQVSSGLVWVVRDGADRWRSTLRAMTPATGVVDLLRGRAR